mgnify:CR=1 FL=1
MFRDVIHPNYKYTCLQKKVKYKKVSNFKFYFVNIG